MSRRWEKLSSVVTFSDRWLTVHSHSYRLPEGQIIEPFHVVDRADWVHIVALTDDMQAVLVREFRAGVDDVVTGFPGGMIEPGEDVLAAAARELREETGYECREWHVLTRAYANWANQSNQITFLLGLGAQETSQQSLDPGEDIAVLRKPWAQLLDEATIEPVHAFHLSAYFLVEQFLKQRKNPISGA